MKLSFFPELQAEPALCFGLSELQIRGSGISGFMSFRSTARYAVNGWQYGGRRFRAVAVTGGGCLLFGTRHALTFMSDVVDHFYFIGPCLSANGVAVAKYDPDHDLWQGVERRMWCRSLRIVSPARASAMIATDRIVRVNPWETHGIPPAVAVA